MTHDWQGEFLKIAHFTGEVKEGIKGLRSDINGLAEAQRKTADCVSSVKKDIAIIKAKAVAYGIAAGTVASAIIKIFF